MLTVSRNAAQRINEIAVQTIFMGMTAFASIEMDNAQSPKLLFKGMRVIIMQNRDKKNGVITGHNAEVLNFEQGTILVKLPNCNILAVHTVMEVIEEGGKRVFYPLVLAYATTICNAIAANSHAFVVI